MTRELDVTTILRKLRMVNILTRLVLNQRQRTLAPYLEDLYLSDKHGIHSFSEDEPAPLDNNFEEIVKKTMKKGNTSKKDEDLLKMFLKC